jgi:hypothetical protein
MKCSKCGKETTIVAIEAAHDPRIVEVRIVCDDKECGRWEYTFVGRDEFVVEDSE